MKLNINIPEKLSQEIKSEPESFNFAITNNSVSLLKNGKPYGYSWDIPTQQVEGISYVKSYRIDDNDVLIRTVKV